MMRWIRDRSAEIVVTALALAAGVGVYAWAHRDEGRLEASKETGAAIVDALERHHADEGSYPASLDELVPRYLPRIDPPEWGLRRWRYRRYSPADVTADDLPPEQAERIYFQLSVAANEGGYPVLFYDYTARRWVLNN